MLYFFLHCMRGLCVISLIKKNSINKNNHNSWDIEVLCSTLGTCATVARHLFLVSICVSFMYDVVWFLTSWVYGEDNSITQENRLRCAFVRRRLSVRSSESEIWYAVHWLMHEVAMAQSLYPEAEVTKHAMPQNQRCSRSDGILSCRVTYTKSVSCWS